MVSDLQLSHHTVEHRISDISTAIESPLHSDLQLCEYFSVAIDESCEIQEKPQLATFTGSVSNECLIKEELLDTVLLKDRTRGIDVKEKMMAAFAKANLPMSKLTANSHRWSASHDWICKRAGGAVQTQPKISCVLEFSLHHPQGATRV